MAGFHCNKARSDYYTNFITENSTDQRRLEKQVHAKFIERFWPSIIYQ